MRLRSLLDGLSVNSRSIHTNVKFTPMTIHTRRLSTSDGRAPVGSQATVDDAQRSTIGTSNRANVSNTTYAQEHTTANYSVQVDNKDRKATPILETRRTRRSTASATKYASKRTCISDRAPDYTNFDQYNSFMPTPRSTADSTIQLPLYKSTRARVSDETRKALLLVNRVREGELLGQMDRNALLQFAKTKPGSIELSKLFTPAICAGDQADAVAAALIHLVKGRVAELACDTDFGPCCVLNLLMVSSGKSDQRVHDAMISELFSSKQNILDTSLTQYGALLIKTIMQAGTPNDQKAIYDALRGHMLELSMDENAGNVVQHARQSFPVELRNLLFAELVASDTDIMRLSRSHKGAFAIKDILTSNSSPDEHKVLVLDAFKANLHGLLDGKESTAAMFSLQLVFSQLPKALRDELIAELLNNPETVARFSCDDSGSRIINDIFAHGNELELKAICDCFRGRMMELALDENGCDLVKYAQELLPLELWKLLGDELLESNERIILLARGVRGIRLLNHILSNRRCLYEHKVQIANSFKENVHTLLEHGARDIMFCLRTVLTNLPQELRRELAAELLARPETVAMYACNEYGSHVISGFIQHGTASEHKAICNGLRGHMVELSINEAGDNIVQRALESLPVELWKPLGDELVASNEIIMSLAFSLKGTFVIKAMLDSDQSPYDHKVRVANAFKAKIHEVLEQGARNPNFSLRIVLSHLPQELRDELTMEMLKLPPGSLMQYAMGDRAFKNIELLVAKLCTADQIKIVADMFAGHADELMADKYGRQVMLALVHRFDVDDSTRFSLIGSQTVADSKYV